MRNAFFVLVIAVVGLSVSNAYHFQLLTFIGINTLLALGLNMLMGYAGQISLGHAAFYGLGAYATAILTVHLNWSPWLALPVAVVLTVVIAFLVALPMLRLSGFYLGMGTLGFGMIGYIIFREWSRFTGGDSGLVGIPSLELGPISFASARNYFYLVWAVVLVCLLLCERLVDSRVGRGLRAIHDSEQAAAAMGIDTSRLKIQIFVLSAVFAALAGFLYAHLVNFISPGSFDFLVSVRIVTMVVIGGMASIWGSLLGASLLTVLPEFLQAFADSEMIVYGLILMVIMIFLPQGLTRGIMDAYEGARTRKASKSASINS
ncbi:branched-chain amino acid ABC transporter permease [Syntrophobacter fumaroxidans]|uniref:Inner-membrane translocator n=1 Tax=Syntrophobacter fumaroxidans (strain DSM 10017 / MPOB) TaxID=335543 RepID=A0LIW4_SYNFM|nr:branched-chain amino acid ABC transporter permease [Syntrophobacter fumaroxidans]ABK17366.1 inner-membrane translocator [Syntrophobacter fumaroxidans MPOB]